MTDAISAVKEVVSVNEEAVLVKVSSGVGVVGFEGGDVV